MSKTACWATNKSFDCAWIHLGYGSIHDMIDGRQYWLSLEGLRILAEYDYDITSPYAMHFDVTEDAQIIKELGLVAGEGRRIIELSPDIIEKLPKKYKMRFSAIHIDHPEGEEKALEWFDAIQDVAGKYYKSGYNELEYYTDYNGNNSITNSSTPSLKAIKDINPYHYECLSRLEYMTENYLDVLQIREKHYEYIKPMLATEDHIKEMLAGWKEEELQREEEFKKLNIWENL